MGDGIGISSLEDPTYTYIATGIFYPDLIVTSDFGCTNEFTTRVDVHELPFADFLIENNCEGELNRFTDISTITNGFISNWEYIFGDGSVNGLLSTEQHQYASAGTYNVTLNIVSDKGCESSIIQETEVYDVPSIDFSSEQYCLGIPTYFTDFSTLNSGHIIQWEWNFGDGIGTANVEHPTYAFSSAGTYAINLLATTDFGCTASLDKNITIVDLPIANFITDKTACLGNEIHFTDLSMSGDASIASWEWSLGDGTIMTIQNPSHEYEYAKTFDVTLAVISAEGCENDTTIPAAVEIFPNPIADFSASTFTTTELLSEIEFYNNSSGAISYSWDFDNAIVSVEENPIIDFKQAKNYEVILNVMSAEGCDSEMIRIVHILPAYTLYAPNSFTPNGDGNNDIFLAEGSGIKSFEMQVFDRWGGLVFESSDIEYGWDGLDASANTVGVGNYMYHISLYDYNGKLWIYNGELNLMR
jgi:gliding motility-associated-like protein